MPSPIDRRPLSIGVSLGILVTAFVVFLQAGSQQSFGPLDLESAQRLALGLWVAAPIVGGLAARGASRRDLRHTAVAVGLVVGLVIALFPGSGTGQYTCTISLPDVPFGSLVGRFAVGGLTGAGMGIGLVVAGVASRRLVTAVPGTILAGVVNFGASAAAYELFYEGVRCLQ
jgi:hypothetical protein